LLSRADDDDKDDSGKDALLVVVALLAASRNVDASIFSVVGDSFFFRFSRFFSFSQKRKFSPFRKILFLQKINSPYSSLTHHLLITVEEQQKKVLKHTHTNKRLDTRAFPSLSSQ
tara:strand:+ start:686 stop:1030 length:345 start_codon:yes stop_codon:yes gene_type:complete